MSKAKMEGRKVLVTGSGTGIGRGIAVEFAKEGAAVALHYAHSDKGAESAVEEIKAFGGKAKAFKADFNDWKQAKELPARAAEFMGGLDVLVNNAGITMNRSIEDVTIEQFDTLFNVNVRAMFFATQGALPALIESKGSIVNISSGHAFLAFVEHSIYSSTKAAIVALTRTLALELIQKGVRVNCIASGWVLVENQRTQLPEDFDETQAGLALPSGFIGEAKDIGRLAIFLSSGEARYIVGQTICCDGGQSIVMGCAGSFREKQQVKWGRGYVPGV